MFSIGARFTPAVSAAPRYRDSHEQIVSLMFRLVGQPVDKLGRDKHVAPGGGKVSVDDSLPLVSFERHCRLLY
jgi:hypothetical protein